MFNRALACARAQEATNTPAMPAPVTLRRLRNLATSFESPSPTKRKESDDDSVRAEAIESLSISSSPVSTSPYSSSSDEERERTLLQVAVGLRPSLAAKSVAGDGNCLYHSVALQTVGAEQHETVRCSVVGEVAENQARYQGFVADVIGLRLKKMMVSGAMA